MKFLMIQTVSLIYLTGFQFCPLSVSPMLSDSQANLFCQKNAHALINAPPAFQTRILKKWTKNNNNCKKWVKMSENR